MEQGYEEIAKRGDTYARFKMSRGYHRPGETDQQREVARDLRTYVGITFWIKGLPVLEEFIKSLGTGDVKPLTSLGRQWVELPGYPNLQIYDVLTSQQDIPGMTIHAPGQALRLPSPQIPNAWIYNISFLRIKGISDGDGIRFGLKDIYQKEEAIQIQHEVGAAVKKFCDAYLCPLDMTCAISSY